MTTKINILEPGKAAWHDDFVLRYHDRECRPACPDRTACSQRFASFLPRTAVYTAADHLERHPRDAQGARLILHDAVCMSSCEGAGRADHARRQTDVVAALRATLAAQRRQQGEQRDAGTGGASSPERGNEVGGRGLVGHPEQGVPDVGVSPAAPAGADAVDVAVPALDLRAGQ